MPRRSCPSRPVVRSCLGLRIFPCRSPDCSQSGSQANSPPLPAGITERASAQAGRTTLRRERASGALREEGRNAASGCGAGLGAGRRLSRSSCATNGAPRGGGAAESTPRRSTLRRDVPSAASRSSERAAAPHQQRPGGGGARGGGQRRRKRVAPSPSPGVRRDLRRQSLRISPMPDPRLAASARPVPLSRRSLAADPSRQPHGLPTIRNHAALIRGSVNRPDEAG